MRIVQLSDIHLNNQNKEDLKMYYMEALLNDLWSFHEKEEIDVIIITGDLIDKGGESFIKISKDPYEIFEEEVLNPIIKKLNIGKDRILMIPGNHDIDRSHIEEETEFYLSEKLTTELANKRCEAFHVNFNSDNKRIQRYKDFERNFHKESPNYIYSNNESTAIFEKENYKFGFVLVNDSWRCSADLKKEQHFIGYKQLLRARNNFNNITDLNVAVFHHPLNAINDDERDEIKSILKTSNYDIALFGHSHRHEADHLSSAVGGYLSLNGRSAFSPSKQSSSKYEPGYNIIDIDLTTRAYSFSARKYISTRYQFDKDTDSLPDGFEHGELPQNVILFPFAEDTNNEDKDLPDSYTADVDRIVSLLIGESIYPDKYAFVRELIQNSVDACNRLKEEYTHVNPKIVISIDSTGNFIEFNDEGDGMTKNVIKNHFAVLGKSISQEYNDNSGKFNLISKFGIGFISTFIAGEKVIINTKSERDGQIIFEIENVFKGFKYIPVSEIDKRNSTGTTIRVYLKKGFNTNEVYNNIRRYCRHIDNLEIKHNNSVVRIEELWNTEDTALHFTDKNPRYEVRLGLGANSKSFFASYCGFLITSYPSPIMPYRFPVHIGGEINFFPKSIDFDISRTNIIPTVKSNSCQREISSALRILFRQALENRPQTIYQQVVIYLQYYLQNFDGLAANMESSYTDFYSKKELISLCSEHTRVDYQGGRLSLGSVLAILKSNGNYTIYIQNNNLISDYHSIVIQYLENKGNLIVQNRNTVVNFKDASQQTTSLTSVIQMIASEHGISLQDINSVQPGALTEMKLDKSTFPERLQSQMDQIQTEYLVTIEIGKFSSTTKPSVSHTNQIFLNFNHVTFQSLLQKMDLMTDDVLKIYLLGLLGLKLSESNSEIRA